MHGILALFGGGEWQEGGDLDRDLAAAAGADEVVVLPTGAAYEQPRAVIEAAGRWFTGLGITVVPIMALDRPSAERADLADQVRRARFIYLAGGSAMHVRSTLMQTTMWEALKAAWHSGATVAGTSAAAMALCDPMVDPRGGAFTSGLGLVDKLAMVAHADTWSEEKLHRTIQLAPRGTPVMTVPEQGAALLRPDGGWDAAGHGPIQVWRDGREVQLNKLG